MTHQTFHLPDLGEGLTEAVLVRWAVAVGDEVALDQVICEVETAKSIVDLPSPYAGTVLRLHAEAGGTIATGAPVLDVAGDAHTAEQEAYRAEEQAGSGNVLIGYGTGTGPVTSRRRRGTAAPSPSPEPSPERGPVAVRSPIVRRLARELGVDPASVTASGSDGAVTRNDVLRAAAAGSTAPALPAGGDGEGASPLRVIHTERFSQLRLAVSERLGRSRAEIPEATVWVDADLTDLLTLRAAMAADGANPPSITALFARYVLIALAEFPLLAARIVSGGEAFERYDGVNLGVAVDTDRGLMVPVLPRADALSLDALDTALRDLAVTARAGRIAPHRLRGSTFTVNNYGGRGVDGSAAIINHPEVAIIGIGRILARPWVVDGEITPRHIAQLSLVFDHRICDGGYAAGFLRTVVNLLEHPLTAYPRI